MTENDGLRRYVEAATALTQITRSRAEELVRELIKAGELERHRAQDWVEDLVKTSRDRSEALVDTVRGEVRQQLKELGFTNVDDLAKKVADILARSSAGGTPAPRIVPPGKAKKTSPKKSGPAKKPAAGQDRGAQDHRARRRRRTKKAGA